MTGGNWLQIQLQCSDTLKRDVILSTSYLLCSVTELHMNVICRRCRFFLITIIAVFEKIPSHILASTRRYITPFTRMISVYARCFGPTPLPCLWARTQTERQKRLFETTLTAPVCEHNDTDTAGLPVDPPTCSPPPAFSGHSPPPWKIFQDIDSPEKSTPKRTSPLPAWNNFEVNDDKALEPRPISATITLISLAKWLSWN